MPACLPAFLSEAAAAQTLRRTDKAVDQFTERISDYSHREHLELSLCGVPCGALLSKAIPMRSTNLASPTISAKGSRSTGYGTTNGSTSRLRARGGGRRARFPGQNAQCCRDQIGSSIARIRPRLGGRVATEARTLDFRTRSAITERLPTRQCSGRRSDVTGELVSRNGCRF